MSACGDGGGRHAAPAPCHRSCAPWPWLAVLLAAGCRVAEVEVVPLRGPVPASVLVLPPVDATGAPDVDVDAVATGADRAVRDRGYRVLPLRVGFDLARRHGVDPRAPGARELLVLGRDAGVDAVLVIEVRDWQFTDGAERSARWDLQWRLVATRDGSEQWSFASRDRWRPPRERPAPVDRPSEEPDRVPFGTPAPPEYRSGAELAAALHAMAMARLPKGGR